MKKNFLQRVETRRATSLRRNGLSMAAAVMMLFATGAEAQVTIGSGKVPESFSVLEVVSQNTRGLRLPHLTTAERDAVEASAAFQAEKTNEAMGLEIFNLDTRCVETWNGTTWIQVCPPEGPKRPPVSLGIASNCTITPRTGSNTVYTAKEDPNAEAHEFFLNGVSQGVQSSNTIIFATAQTIDDVTVRYFYPPAFLKSTMIAVQGGTFTLGAAVQADTDGMGGNGAVTNSHSVTLSDFYMSETEITQAQFEAVMGVNPAGFVCSRDVDYFPSSAKPVEYVSWYDAIAYCNKLSLQEGRTPVYSVLENGVEVDWANITLANIPENGAVGDEDWGAATQNLSANGYRLPTEAEWEYAARGGQLSESITGRNSYDFYYSGSNTANDVAWYSGNNGSAGTATYGTKAVKQKQPNALGLYDMTGNVDEWCWDKGGDYTSGTVTNPVGPPPTDNTRVLRGSHWGWFNNDTYIRVNSRTKATQGDRGFASYDEFYLGFRVVCRSFEP